MRERQGIPDNAPEWMHWFYLINPKQNVSRENRSESKVKNETEEHNKRAHLHWVFRKSEFSSEKLFFVFSHSRSYFESKKKQYFLSSGSFNITFKIFHVL